MTSLPSVQYASRTDKGMRRAMNQDSLQVRMSADYAEWSRCGYLFVVADGMGGHAVGDLASRIAVDTLPHAYFKGDAPSVENRLREAIISANKAINSRGRENREFEGMGTTCSVLSLSECGAMVGHVGDSRVYRVRKARIEQLTFDHSLQWEMIRLGRATPENVELFHPRNVITRCLGPDPVVQVDIEGPFSVEAGDFFLLCSDGLTNHVSDTEIGQIVGSMPPTESSRLLINLANCRGGSDNSTVIVVGIDSYPTSSESSPTNAHAGPGTTTAEMPTAGRSAFWRTFLSFAAGLCLVAGIWLATQHNKPASAVMCAASALALLIRLRLTNRRTLDLADSGYADAGGLQPASKKSQRAGDSPADTDDSRTASIFESSSASRAAFLPTAPYRIVDAELTEPLLSNLAEVQSELVQAARDSGWKVDFDELTQLNRQAIQSLQSEKLERAIRARGKAIDLLMRELYQRSRSN
ncbi:MAG: serine/threonine-protein phosphatase [Planctomycetota bacterium]|nr:MAG: serine/threonine-protein phosphatase [Planctomycetota bacterium]